jgi:lipid II:glycine glycyltransferase (peptidoglycan interpeptide bridge formation enzyme)
MARYDGEAAAGNMQFLVNDRTNLHFYNCHYKSYRDLAPVNLLLDREIEWSLTKGYDFLDLGTTVEHFEWNSGLMRFKESFGATGQFRTVYSVDV